MPSASHHGGTGDPPVQSGDSPDCPTGITPAELARHEQRQAGIARANADPLPGPLGDAITPESPTFCGLLLREVVPTDLGLLKRLDSPLHREMLQLARPIDERIGIEYTDEELWELLYIFTRPARAARATLAQGRPQFRETALAYADSLPPAAMTQRVGLILAVSTLWMRAFSTIIEHAAPATDDGNFCEPPAQPTTGSAGG